MGNLFKKAEQYIQQVDSNDVFVEIGATSGANGSTHYLANLAGQHKTVLHSVDIDERTHIFQFINPMFFVGHCAVGSAWAKDIFPTLHKKIALLYLDNYDYDHWNRVDSPYEQQKKYFFEKHNLKLNNVDSTVEHLKQMISLLPYMSKNSVVICDDTYLFNNCWSGKCSAVVPYLMAHGFCIAEIESDKGVSHGVVLTR